MTFWGKFSIRTKLQLMTEICNRYRFLCSRFDCGCGMKSKWIPLHKWKKRTDTGKKWMKTPYSNFRRWYNAHFNLLIQTLDSSKKSSNWRLSEMKFLSAVRGRTRTIKLGTNIWPLLKKIQEQRKRLARIGRDRKIHVGYV
jgi:hypothetical protein